MDLRLLTWLLSSLPKPITVSVQAGRDKELPRVGALGTHFRPRSPDMNGNVAPLLVFPGRNESKMNINKVQENTCITHFSTLFKLLSCIQSSFPSLVNAYISCILIYLQKQQELCSLNTTRRNFQHTVNLDFTFFFLCQECIQSISNSQKTGLFLNIFTSLFTCFFLCVCYLETLCEDI